MQPLPTQRPTGDAPNRTEAVTPRPRNSDETRTWPRYEPAFTHFELGAPSEYQPTAVMAKRYTPRYGARK
jgi:hypothetical protein